MFHRQEQVTALKRNCFSFSLASNGQIANRIVDGGYID